MKRCSSICFSAAIGAILFFGGQETVRPADLPILIRAAHILPVASPEISPGQILIENGKIVEIGGQVKLPPEAEEIDAGSGWIIPGLFQFCTTLGTMGTYGTGSGSDEVSNPDTAQLRIIDGINPFENRLAQARMAGITAFLAAPGRLNVIGGQAAVLKPYGSTVEEMCLLQPAGIKISLGEGPKDTYGKKGRLPSTRMGSAFVLRAALLEAGAYRDEWEVYRQKLQDLPKKKQEGIRPPKRDLRLEALARLCSGELPALIECYRADDIMTALRIIDEFSLRAVLVGCAEGARLADQIAEAGVPVVVSPFGVGPRRMETGELSRATAARLAAAGVKIIIRADESLGIGHVRELPLQAALAVSGGLDRESALRAVTLSPAEAAGVGDRIGSLEVGKDADLVILDGDPFDYRARVKRVIINGKTVFPMKDPEGDPR
jgi:imidazolonepropionase-like amidohydrolase